MVHDSKVLVMDVDGTLCEIKRKDQSYLDVTPRLDVLERLRSYKSQGFWIVLHTSRQMRTYEGNLGAINANTLPVLIDWLRKHDVPYDEIHVGKPWAGREGFYVDDKTVRPDEFLKLDYDDIKKLLGIS